MNSKIGRRARNLAGSFLTAMVALLMATSVMAQTGKISVTVTDAKTGEALVRASVSIVSPKKGAYSNEKGVATIVNVPPGETYTVIAKYVGYGERRFENVKVQSDVTTNLTAKLAREGDTVIVVEARRLMVEKSQTEQGRKFSATEVQNTPGRQRLDEIIKLTPGVMNDNANGGLSINGGRSYQNSVKINGVETQDVVDGRSSAIQNSLSKFAVSELDIKTSGSDASSGNNLGGGINTSTRTGGDKWTMNAHYRTEVPGLFGRSSNGYKQMPEGNQMAELAFGGPVIEGLGFFGTVKGWQRDYYNYFTEPVYSNGGLGVTDPAGNNLGQVPNTDFYSRSMSGNLTYNLEGFRLQGGVIYGHESRRLGGVGTIVMDQDLIPARNEEQSIYSLQVTGPIGEANVQLNGSFQQFVRDYGRIVPGENYGLFNAFKIYAPSDNFTYDESNRRLIPGSDGIIDIYTPVSRQIPDPADPANPKNLSGAGINPITGKIEGNAITLSTANPYGLQSAYVVAGNIGGFSTDTRDQIQLDGNFRQQLGTHFLTVGFDGRLFEITRNENSLPWDANPFKDSFAVSPFMGGLYVTDKMEFSDITFNPSLRFDIFNPGAREIVDLENPLASGLQDSPTQTQLSPRLGITYAVTEQTTFNFNYNWYFKSPLLNDVLTNLGGDLSKVLTRGNQIIGNGGLKAERAKEIVVGFNTQLTEVFAFEVRGVYKDFRNQSGLQQISSEFLPVGYTIYSDDQYGNYRALQFTAEKRLSNNWGARVNYTYSSSRATSSSALENYSRLLNNDPTGEVVALPLTPFASSSDKPHVLQLILNTSFKPGEGPLLFGVDILQHFSANLTSVYESGIPYTKSDTRGRQIGEFNADRHPEYIQSDATISRSIPFAGLFGESMSDMFLDLELEITNLFNRTEPLYVFPATGQGDDDGSDGRYVAPLEFENDPTNTFQYDALGRPLYNARWDLNRDDKVSREEQQLAFDRLRSDRLSRRTSFQAPRRVFFNVSFRF
ncbi:MAG TPA: carboxypeptidase regulatory-like domain-containing protein [Candidatus Kapabacteria bacterium]|nr:carboxypeptidase regulatory-like domain-containing protein [Candidatus Kapabacteria bacterium]